MEAASDTPAPALTAAAFDRMIAEIRAGAVLALLLLASSVWSLARGEHWFGIRALTIVELLVHGSCAVAIYHLSRIGSALLLVDMILRAAALLYLVGPLTLLGLLFAFVPYRSLVLSRRLHALVAQAESHRRAEREREQRQPRPDYPASDLSGPTEPPASPRLIGAGMVGAALGDNDLADEATVDQGMEMAMPEPETSSVDHAEQNWSSPAEDTGSIGGSAGDGGVDGGDGGQ